jgi:hypothetical protein
MIYDVYIRGVKFMRTLIDIPEQQLKELQAICSARQISRAEAVRQAVAAFVAQNRLSREAAFGAWKNQNIRLPGESEPLPQDGLAYQKRLRSEW